MTIDNPNSCKEYWYNKDIYAYKKNKYLLICTLRTYINEFKSINLTSRIINILIFKSLAFAKE
jgi:hypothetical protein